MNLSGPSAILSRASKVGSPTNHPCSRQRQDTGPGIFWSVHRWTKPNGLTHVKHLNITSLVIAIYKKLKKETDRTLDPFLLRQGEPGTSQYIAPAPGGPISRYPDFNG